MKVRIGVLAHFLSLFAFWMALSDEWRPLFIAMGAVASALVTVVTFQIVRTVLVHPDGDGGGRPVRRAAWFVVYLAWMLGRIVVASGQVAYFALHPGIPFQPRFVRFRTTMRRPLSRVVLANSITLVPGTLTVGLEDDEYLVHTLMPASARDIETARMQNLVARFLGEQDEAPPQMHWGPLIEEAVR